MIPFFLSFDWFFVFTRLRIYSTKCLHFLHFWFFTQIFIHNYICMWKITTTMKIIIILIIQYFSLKFIPFRFYIWKITKTKSLSLVSKKGYPNCEYALFSIIFIMKTNQMFIVCNDFMGVKHGFHVFKCDLILKCLLMCF